MAACACLRRHRPKALIHRSRFTIIDDHPRRVGYDCGRQALLVLVIFRAGGR